MLKGLYGIQKEDVCIIFGRSFRYARGHLPRPRMNLSADDPRIVLHPSMFALTKLKAQLLQHAQRHEEAFQLLRDQVVLCEDLRQHGSNHTGEGERKRGRVLDDVTLRALTSYWLCVVFCWEYPHFMAR